VRKSSKRTFYVLSPLFLFSHDAASIIANGQGEFDISNFVPERLYIDKRDHELSVNARTGDFS